MTARSPLPRACGGCGIGEGTFAGVSGNDEDAPIPDLASLATEREGPTHISRSGRSTLWSPGSSDGVARRFARV